MIATEIVTWTGTGIGTESANVPWTGRWTGFPTGGASVPSPGIATVANALSTVDQNGWRTAGLIEARIAAASGIGAVIVPWTVVIVLLRGGIRGTTGIPAMRGVEIGDRIARLIVRLNGRAVVAAVADIASRAVETAVAVGISGITVTSARRAVAAVVVVDIASIREVAVGDIISSVTRTMEAAVAAAVRTSPGSSPRRPRSPWCRRSP